MATVFGTEEAVCPLCNGSRMTPHPTNPGSLMECRCLIKRKYEEYLGDLLRYATLRDSKLVEFLKSRKSLLIEMDDYRALYAHLKTALLKNKDLDKSWKIVTPNELVAISFNDKDRSIYEVSLLVVNAASFPFWDAAAKQHEYVMSIRASMGKQTFFALPSLKRLIDSRDIKLSEGFVRLLKSLPAIRISKLETISLLKEKKTKVSINSQKGLGISGIDEGLLVFNPEVSSRIHKLKESYYGRA